MDWFERLTGFREAGYADVRSRLELEGSTLRSRENGRRCRIGHFELVSLQTLRDRVAAEPVPAGRLSIRNVQGDVRRMHGEPAYAGALFQVASQFNGFFAQLEIPGYLPPPQPLRSTNQYWAPDLAGVWARAPYLHNGSMRTMQELLTSPGERETRWHRGTRQYDVTALGYTDEGDYVFDSTGPGNSKAGHNYGTQLTAGEKRDLIEYLKTK